ncbi:hypothetical protein RZN25_05615 [Bacillaceae bacterium S4-13-56]
MTVDRRIELNRNYKPLPTYEGDEVFRNGFFYFNITRILEQIESGGIRVEEEVMDVEDWFKSHFHHGSINEGHLPTVDVTNPILLAEIRPGMFNVIDGNHRIEKAYREGIPTIHAYRLRGEQLLPFFTEEDRYRSFVDYWNSKL